MLKHRVLPLAGLALAFAITRAGPGLAAASSDPAMVGVATLHWTPQPFAADDGAGGLRAPSTTIAEGQLQSAAARADQAGRSATNSVAVALVERSFSAVNTALTINAISLVSGAGSLQESALSGFSDIGNNLMDAGANNLQSATSVTIVITP